MTKENNDTLIKTHPHHKKLEISNQNNHDKSYLDSIIANSVSLVDSDCGTVIDQSELGNWSIKPSIVDIMVDIMEFMVDKDLITTDEIVNHFDYNPSIANQCLHQLTELGYLKAISTNDNRTYKNLKRYYPNVNK